MIYSKEYRIVKMHIKIGDMVSWSNDARSLSNEFGPGPFKVRKVYICEAGHSGICEKDHHSVVVERNGESLKMVNSAEEAKFTADTFEKVSKLSRY